MLGSSAGTQTLPTSEEELKRDYYVNIFSSSLFNPVYPKQLRVEWCLLAQLGSWCSVPHHSMTDDPYVNGSDAWSTFLFLLIFGSSSSQWQRCAPPDDPLGLWSDASLLIRARFKKWFKEYTWVQCASCLLPFVRVPLTQAVGLFCQFLRYEKDYKELTIRSRLDASSSLHRKVPRVLISPCQIALLWFPFICPSAPTCTHVEAHARKKTRARVHTPRCVPWTACHPPLQMITVSFLFDFGNLRDVRARSAHRWGSCHHTPCHRMPLQHHTCE